jgi:transposase InsO family protein
MDKPKTRLDTRKHRKQLRDIGSLRRSNLPEKTKQRLRILSWHGRKSVETICRFFNISKSWFYRLLNTFHTEGLRGLMKKPGRPKGSTIPEPAAKEIKRVREANPRIGSRRIKWLLGLRPHHSTVHRLLRSLGLVKMRPYRRRVWKRFRAEAPNKRWQTDVTEILLHGNSLYKITLVDDHSNIRLASRLSWDATGATVAGVLEAAVRRYGAPEELLSDNGAQFRGRKGGETLDVGGLCRRYGIRQVFTSPNHPQTIGKAEHAHRDDKMEFFDLVEFETIEEGQVKLDLFDVWQNGCPNRGLMGRSPGEAYGRPISHRDCAEAFYLLYLGQPPLSGLFA